jgi:hypothetical protein
MVIIEIQPDSAVISYVLIWYSLSWHNPSGTLQGQQSKTTIQAANSAENRHFVSNKYNQSSRAICPNRVKHEMRLGLRDSNIGVESQGAFTS